MSLDDDGRRPADERTPLITHDARHPVSTVAEEAERVVRALRSDNDAPTDISDPDAELAILLYTYLRLHDDFDREMTLETIAEYREEQRADQEVIFRLDSDIADLLYIGGSRSPGCDAVEVFLSPHTLDDSGRYIAVLDLLALPVGKGPSDFLGHPLVLLILERVWAQGRTPSKTGRGVRGSVPGCVSPRRLHLWHFAASLTLWVLSLAIAIRPQHWITPYEEGGETGTTVHQMTPTALEITWLVFALGLAVQILQRGTRWLSLPTVITACLALLPPGRDYAYTALLVSIPCLTLSLIRPAPPAIPFLTTSLLPHSLRLFGSLRRSVRGLALVLPLALAMFVVFSISMNGDLSRGFFLFPLSLSPSSAGGSTPTPVEHGVAPFEARVIISLTLVMLVYLALVLVFSGSPGVTDRGRSSKVWDVAYGGTAAHTARVQWIRGIRWLSGDSLSDPTVEAGLDPPALPVPLNIVLVPLDIVLVFSRSADRLRSHSDQKLSPLSRMLDRIRFTVATGLAGCLCWPFGLIESLLRRAQL